MAKGWIEKLADEIKDNGREAAESYGREQHRAGIIDTEGKAFFLAVVGALEQDFTELRGQLQGSAVSCETSVIRTSPSEAKLVRNRFPWFDATLKHTDQDVSLDYTQGRGAPISKILETEGSRVVTQFRFQVDTQDKISIVQSFGDSPRSFETPEDFAQHLVEILFRL